jgi:hypothetical protein
MLKGNSGILTSLASVSPLRSRFQFPPSLSKVSMFQARRESEHKVPRSAMLWTSGLLLLFLRAFLSAVGEVAESTLERVSCVSADIAVCDGEWARGLERVSESFQGVRLEATEG